MFGLFKNFLLTVEVWLKYFLILILTTVFRYFYPEYISFWFIIILFSLVPFSLVYIIIGAFFIKIKLELETTTIIRNEEVNLNILFFNKSFFPFSKIEIKYSVPQKIGLSSENKIICFNLLARKHYKYKQKTICKHVGKYKSNIIYIKISDLFGFFKLRLKSKAETEFLVLPNKIFVPKLNSDLFSNIENNLSKVTKINTSDIFGTRDYILGDELKLIHWKNSAKIDDIVIKEFEEKKDITGLIILDLKKYYNLEKSSIAIDGIIEAATSTIEKFISSNIKINVVWYEENKKDIELKFLEDNSNINDFFKYLAALNLYANDISLEKILNISLDYSNNYSIVFIITAYIDSNLINYLSKLNIQIVLLYIKLNDFNYNIPSHITLINIKVN